MNVPTIVDSSGRLWNCKKPNRRGYHNYQPVPDSPIIQSKGNITPHFDLTSEGRIYDTSTAISRVAWMALTMDKLLYHLSFGETYAIPHHVADNVDVVIQGIQCDESIFHRDGTWYLHHGHDRFIPVTYADDSQYQLPNIDEMISTASSAIITRDSVYAFVKERGCIVVNRLELKGLTWDGMDL